MTTAFHDERLTAYLDDELTPAERVALEADIARSAALRAELEALRRVSELVRAHGRVPAPPGVLDAVHSRIDSEPVELAWWRRARRPLGVPLEGWLVAAAAAAVLAVTLPNPLRAPTSDTASQAPAGARVEVPWQYTVFVHDPAAVTALRALVEPLDGALIDVSSGNSTDDAPLVDAGRAVWVRLPDARLDALDGVLRQIGTVERVADGRSSAPGRVDVRVELRVASAPVNFTPSTRDAPAKPDDAQQKPSKNLLSPSPKK